MMNKKKKKPDKPEQPTEPKEPTEPKPTTEPKAEKPPKEPKKRGRKPGSKNKPKSEKVPRKRRKAPTEYTDTKAALKGLASDFNVVAKKHNKENPTDKIELLDAKLKSKRDSVPKPLIPASACEAVVVTSFEMVGQMWEVTTRPDEASVKACAESWAVASGYLEELDPKYVAIGMAGVTTFACMVPMYREKRARARGEWTEEKPPKSEEVVP